VPHTHANRDAGGELVDAQEWLTVILKDDNYWDQNAFNDLMRRGAEFEERRDDRLFKCATVAASL
jgi:hypothetical protein